MPLLADLLGRPDGLGPRLAELQQAGNRALGAMDRYLADHDFLVAERFTIADISLYAYTHVADEGGFDLGAYPQIQAWLGRVAAQPGHVSIDA